MKFQLVSDLHVECRPQVLERLVLGWRDPEAEGLVMAGDICPWVDVTLTQNVLDAVRDWPWVIWVPGNHEYWDSSPEQAHDAVRLAMDLQGTTNVHVATSPGFVERGGQRFACGTMWWPKDPKVSDAGFYARHGKLGTSVVRWTDFEMVPGLAPWVYHQNAEFDGLLKDVLPGDVVVTHHLPSERSVPEKFRRSDTGKFYVSDQEYDMVSQEPRLWLHGHTHDPFDYEFHATRVVCNPLGNPGERKLQDYSPVTLEV
jgi:predicted phosphodiesterase